MKVLLHCVYYPPEVGGLESHVAALAEGLAARGHEVRVVTSRSLPHAAPREQRSGVDVIRSWFPSRSPAGWILHALGSMPATREGARWADVVHAQAFASILPCHLATFGGGQTHPDGGGKPLVATFHTSHFLVRAQVPRWKPVLRRLVEWPDHALAASAEIAAVAEALAPGTRVEAVTNGVETDRFRPVAPSLPPEPGTRQVVIPRRLFPKNGVEFAVRALPLVAKAIPGVRFLFVGDGPERSRLEALAGELGVGGEARFLGSRPHEEMPGVLSSAELAVFPSLMEATSVAALECMACELPVVASNVGGLPEIVDAEVGALVPPADPEALAAAIIGALGRPDRLEAGARARRRVVDHWSNDRLVERHLEIYRTLLAERRPGTGRSRTPDTTPDTTHERTHERTHG
ncbi:MAG: glycosyltransferase family 1 protein [Gemmatimonadales bacterium]|nr:MAG: glycosyltransferase family 1 protein [Gemmatimonadales bacterium]